MRIQGSHTGSRTKGASSGHTLVEMVVVISILSLILSSVAVMLHGMYRADQGARQELETSIHLDRLASRLRADAASVDSAEVKDDTMVLRFSDGRRLEYRFARARVERTVLQDEQTDHHDTFRLTGDSSVVWKVGSEEMPFVSLIVSRSEGIPARIDARLRADRRFERVISP